MPTSSKKKVLYGGDSESDEEDYAQMDAEFQPAEPTADKSYDEDEEVGDEDTDRVNVQTKSSKPHPLSFQEQKKALRKQLKSRLSAAQLDKIRASFPVDLHQKGGEAPIPHPVAHLPPEGAAWVQKESRRLLVGRFAMTKVEEQRQSEEAERREVEAALLPYYHHLQQQQQEDTSSRSPSPSDLPNRTRSSHSPNSQVSSPSKQLIAKSLGLPVGSHFVEKMQEKSREAGWTCAVVQQSPHSSIADACAKHSTMQAYQKMKEQKAMMHASRHQHHHLHHTKRSDALSAAAASAVNNSSLTSAVDVDGLPPQLPSEEEVRRGLMLLNDDMLKAEATQMLQEVLQRGGGGSSNSGGSGGSPLGSTNASPIPSSTTALPPLRESPSPSFRQYGTSPHPNSSSSSALRLVTTTQAASHATVGRRSPDHSIQCGSPVAFSPIRTLSSPMSSSPFETTGKGKPTAHKLAPLDRTTSTLHGGSGSSVTFQSPPPLVQKDVAVIKASLSVLAHPSVVPLSYSLGHTKQD